MKQAVLLLAHGAPERLEDVEPYLELVREGRPLPPPLVEEIRGRYAAIGGCSPLTRWTRAQATALEAELGIPVCFGMRNWRPFIREAAERIAQSGIERVVAICLAPQYSKLSVGLYIERTEQALREAGAAVEVVWTRSFHDHPLLIEAFAEKLAFFVPARRVIFTAHSLPERILTEGDPYDAECRATAAAVAARMEIADWELAYQSRGLTDEKWLGPTVEFCLERCAAEGIRSVVVHPIGFVCDHVEVLYDVDAVYRRFAAEREIILVRPESLNDSPRLTAALADIARKQL